MLWINMNIEYRYQNKIVTCKWQQVRDEKWSLGANQSKKKKKGKEKQTFLFARDHPEKCFLLYILVEDNRWTANKDGRRRLWIRSKPISKQYNLYIWKIKFRLKDPPNQK